MKVQHIVFLKLGTLRPTRFVFFQVGFGLVIVHQRDLRLRALHHVLGVDPEVVAGRRCGGIWFAIFVSSRMKTKTAATIMIFFMASRNPAGTDHNPGRSSRQNRFRVRGIQYSEAEGSSTFAHSNTLAQAIIFRSLKPDPWSPFFSSGRRGDAASVVRRRSRRCCRRPA